MKLVALATLEKVLMIWDLPRKNMIIRIDMELGGIHSMKYFETYQVKTLFFNHSTSRLFYLSFLLLN